MDDGEEPLLQALALHAAAPRALPRKPRLRLSADAAERSDVIRRAGAEGPLDLAHLDHVGDPVPRLPRSRHLRLDGCAHELHLRPRVRERRSREARSLLARRRAPRREGHRPLPRRLLAGVPDVSRSAAAEAGSGTRLVAPRPTEDLEVSWRRRASGQPN